MKQAVGKIYALIFILILCNVGIFAIASDKSDAEALGEKCRLDSEILQIPVKNFGSEKDISDFENALKLIKIGRVYLSQAKYLDAKARFEEYQKLQYSIYESLASKYLERTQKVLDESGIDLADHIDNKEVEKYLKLAAQNLFDAKNSMGSKHYTQVIGFCRTSKGYSLAAYGLVNKKTPEKYHKDLSDNNKKIGETEKK